MATLKSLLLATSFLRILPAVQAIQYTLYETFSGATFFDNFNFVTYDPSGGWVTYVDQATAQAKGYAVASSSGAYIGVDHSSVLTTSAGRQSVRIESKTNYQNGLFITDIAHMPQGCGTWPAFWMLGGGTWPDTGEVDILEGVNLQSTNQVSSHTSSGCTISGTHSLAALGSADCNAAGDVGCWFSAHRTTSYGAGFNANGGGIYAVQWNANWISVWFWEHNQVPSNVLNNNPDPATWGLPMAMFAGACNIDQHFVNMRFVLNIDFCGAWANALWSQSTCASYAATCGEYVANNPSAFAGAYWHINSIKVFYPLHLSGSAKFKAAVSQQPPAPTPTVNATVTLAPVPSTPVAQTQLPSQPPVPSLAVLKPADAMGGSVAANQASAAAAAGFTPVTNAKRAFSGEGTMEAAIRRAEKAGVVQWHA